MASTAGADRRHRLSRPDGAARRAARADGAARRRPPAGRADRHRRGLRPARRRRRGGRAGRAAGAGLSPRARRASCRERPVAVRQHRRRRQRHLDRRATARCWRSTPGRAMRCIDDWMLAHTGAAHDDDGALRRARAACDEDVLQELLTNHYFGAPPPKSLDRNAFSPAPVDRLSLEDGAATLTAFTAAAIGKAREHMPEEPRAVDRLRRRPAQQPTLMSMIAADVQNAVVPAEAARPRRRQHRGRGLGLSRRALAAEAADHLPRHHRRALADDRRHLSRRPLASEWAAGSGSVRVARTACCPLPTATIYGLTWARERGLYRPKADAARVRVGKPGHGDCVMAHGHGGWPRCPQVSCGADDPALTPSGHFLRLNYAAMPTSSSQPQDEEEHGDE